MATRKIGGRTYSLSAKFPRKVDAMDYAEKNRRLGGRLTRVCKGGKQRYSSGGVTYTSPTSWEVWEGPKRQGR